MLKAIKNFFHFVDQIPEENIGLSLLEVHKCQKPKILAEDAGHISKGNCGGWSWPPDGQVIVPSEHFI